jgi:hypothetical protein
MGLGSSSNDVEFTSVAFMQSLNKENSNFSFGIMVIEGYRIAFLSCQQYLTQKKYVHNNYTKTKAAFNNRRRQIVCFSSSSYLPWTDQYYEVQSKIVHL